MCYKHVKFVHCLAPVRARRDFFEIFYFCKSLTQPEFCNYLYGLHLPNHPTAIIQTERLILRQWCDQDRALYRKLNADPRVMEFFPSPWTQEESDASLQSARNHIEKYGWGKWAASLLETDEFIGRIGLEEVDFQASSSSNIELGYRIAYKHWGKGYATEGAKAALEYGFRFLNLEEIVAFTPVQNLRSQIVMQRIGMHHSPKDDFDHPKLPENHRLKKHVLYRLKAEQWQGIA